MRKQIIYTALALAAFTSCQEEGIDLYSGATGESIIVSLPSNGVETRMEFTDTESSLALSWDESDKFSIYTTDGVYMTDYQYATSTETSSAIFNPSGDVALSGGVSYIAIFPATQDASLSLDEYRTALKNALATQTQAGNDDKSHYNNYLQMEGEFAYSATENTYIRFAHKMAAIRLTFEVEDGVTPSSMAFTDGSFASYTLDFSEITDGTTYTANYVIVPNEEGVSREVAFNLYTEDSGENISKSFTIETDAVYSAGTQYRSELSVDDVSMTIYTLDDFLLFQSYVAAGQTTAKCILRDNIDLKGSAENQWTPIGTDASRFAGVIDGNGYTIEGLYIDSENEGLGLIGYCDGAVVKNLTVEGTIIGLSNQHNAAIAACAYNSIFTNCSTTAATTISALKNTAAIAGYANGVTIDNCTNYASIKGGKYTGGMAGYVSASAATTITNSTNNGILTDGNQTEDTSDYMGGIAGYLQNSSSKIEGCTNNAGVICSTIEYVGGIVGANAYGAINNCTNKASVEGDEHVGGICGESKYYTIVRNCSNSGDITSATYYVGGMVGYTYGSTIVGCYNTGTINGAAFGAGITGGNASSTTTACYNAGYVNVATFGGSVVGSNIDGSLTYSYNDGSVCTKAIIGSESTGTYSNTADYNTEYMQGDDFVSIMNNVSYIYNLTASSLSYGWVKATNGYPTLDATVTPTKREVAATTIATADELAKIGVDESYSVFDSYILTDDIDLSGISWTPIKEFLGTFDGDGYTISGLTIDASHGTKYDYGLFMIVSSGAVVKNLHVEGDIDLSAITGIQSIGLISGYLNLNGTIENCTVSGTIKAAESKYIGGVVGYINNSSTITNCSSQGEIVVTESSYIGGISGYTTSSATMDNCHSAMSVTCTGVVNDGSDSRARVGGIVGYLDSSAIAINCSNSGAIYSDFKHTAGIAGRLESGAYIYNCYNTGDVYSYARSGGIVGCAVSSTIDNCYNIGTITSDTSYSLTNENGYDYDNLHGGVIGETWNVQYVQNAYFLSTSTDPSKGIGMDQYSNLYLSKGWSGYLTVTSKEETEMTATTFIETLNSNASSISGAKTWVAGSDGYPTFAE